MAILRLSLKKGFAYVIKVVFFVLVLGNYITTMLLPREMESLTITNTALPIVLSNTSSGYEELSDTAFDNLYPAVVKCFAVIFCGFIAGKLGWISQMESKGLNTFVGTFCLPALIFNSMATLDFGIVNWRFLLAIFLSKTTIFLVVLIVTLIASKPTNLAKAGLYAIFCSQSNDFALGYPIVSALYSQTHPEYPSYLYLVAPVSLVFLNPIAFCFMECGHQQDLSRAALTDRNTKFVAPSGCRLVLTIAKSVLLNPVVLMTSLGCLSNVTFGPYLPAVLQGVLNSLGLAFSATALFLLGLRMVGQGQQFNRADLVTPGLLIVVKCLVFPIITREMVSLVHTGITTNATLDLSDYGFLYGTFPSAPSVFVYASQFHVATELIAGAMVACTFLSAPVMFVSAKMVTLSRINPSNYLFELDAFLFDVSVVGLVCVAWVLLIFMVGKKWKQLPHFFTMSLLLAQSLGCLGALFWSVLGCNTPWQLYLQFGCIVLGVFGARVWTALLAVSLYLLRTRSLCFVLKLRLLFSAIGWGIPALIVVVLLSAVSEEAEIHHKTDPNFQYGHSQALFALVILILSFLVTIVSLVLHQRNGKRHEESREHPGDDTESLLPDMEDLDQIRPMVSCEPTARATPAAPLFPSSSTTNLTTLAFNRERLDPIVEIRESDDGETMIFGAGNSNMCPPKECGPVQRQQCSSSLRRYRNARVIIDREEDIGSQSVDGEQQILRHVVLLLVLTGSMFVGLALCIWRLCLEEVSGVYLELLFLDGALNFGQAFFTFLCFGLDVNIVFSPLYRRWRRWRFGVDRLVLPRWEALNEETRHICEQFVGYHMDKCVRDLVRNRRRRLQLYRDVFQGKDLVDWLILVGLSQDRAQGERYGKHLLMGRVIRHFHREHHFHDRSLLYVFTVAIRTPRGI